MDHVAGLARVISTAATGVLVAACLTLSAQTTPAHANADLALGQQVFEGNCGESCTDTILTHAWLPADISRFDALVFSPCVIKASCQHNHDHYI